jgi:hypothetical protein
MQSASLEFTRLIPESISPDHSFGGFNASGFYRDEPRLDSASLMHPSIDHETQFTPLSSSELLIHGRLIVLRQVFSDGFGKVRFFGIRVCIGLN